MKNKEDHMRKLFCLLLVLMFLPVFVFADESVVDPVGRWTILSDYSEMAYNFLYSKVDYFFFEDGTLFCLSVRKDKNGDDLSISCNSGIWLSDSDSIVLRTDKTYKCLINSDGLLLLYLGDEAHLTFSRVCN